MVFPFGKRNSPPGTSGAPAGRLGQRPQPPLRDQDVNLPGRFHRYWWQYDSSRRFFRHISSGEEIRFIGPIAPPRGASGRWPWYRFDYVCPEARFPLAVEFKKVVTVVPTAEQIADAVARDPNFRIVTLRSRKWHPAPQIWRVDYGYSAELWRDESGSAAHHPPYGLWRRADEALIGSALAWPPVEVEGPPCDEIAANGGWLNGTWTGAAYRRIRRDWVTPEKSSHFYPFEADGSVVPHLWPLFHDAREYAPIPLDEAPTQWIFAPRQVAVETERWKFTQEIVPTAFDPSTGATVHTGNLWHYSRSLRGETVDDTPRPMRVPLFEGLGVYINVSLASREMRLHSHIDPNPLACVSGRANLMALRDEDAFERRFGPISSSAMLFRPGARPGPHLGPWQQDYGEAWNCALMAGPLHNYNFARYLRIASLDVLSVATGFENPGCADGLSFTQAGTVEVDSLVAGMPNCNYFLRTVVDPIVNNDGWSWREVFDG